jgi:two-component system cell cycle response regulator
VNQVLDQARAALVELNLQVQMHAQQVQSQAQRDQLTSLYNRAFMSEVLPQQFEMSVQLSQPLSVIFVDIDNFKAINDTHGHHGGDAVLVAVAKVLQSATRNCDTVIRFGGDEFVVLLANSSEQIGALVAERIRSLVEARPADLGDGRKIATTVSLGCATMTSKVRFASSKELLEAADRCLYAAKSGGRNRVITDVSLGQ